MKRFEEIKKMYKEQKHLLNYNDIEDLIQMVDLLIQVKQIIYEETKDYEIESLKFKNEGLSKQIDNYRYFPERLKEEIYKLVIFSQLYCNVVRSFG